IVENKLIQIPYYDTAGAVKMIKEQRLLDAGAIASKLAAQVYEMDILDSNLDSEDNVTTFYLIKLQ
ncbi:MAG: prephenate dehydratase domain-containing protein, partial [Candidatus Heimdallarchaeota archaeon]